MKKYLLAVKLAAALICVGAVAGLTVCRLDGVPYCVVKASVVGDAYVQEVASTAETAAFPVVFC